MSHTSTRRLFHRIVIALILIVGLAAISAALSVWRAARAISTARGHAPDASLITATVAPLRASNSRFQTFGSPAGFRAAAVYSDSLFVCGSSALFQFDSSGRQINAWHAGQQLPAAPLTTLTVRRGAGSPELWIGTEGAGVLIYDGQSFRQLLPQNVAMRKITAMLPLSGGQVLLGTPEDGLLVSRGQDLRLFHPQFQSAQITALAGTDDSLWIGTRNQGVWLWRGGQVTRFVKELPDPQVFSLAASGNTAWTGTALGVVEFVNGAFHRRLADNYFAQSLAFRDNFLYVGTVDEGMVTVNLAGRPSRQLVPVESPVTAFLSGPSTLLAITSDSVRALPSNEQVVHSSPGSLTSAHITAIHAGANNRLWIGYFDRGIDILPASGAGGKLHFEDDRIFCINRIKQAPGNGVTAIATANGLALFDQSEHLRQVLDRTAGLIASHVTDVLFGNDSGDMIAATPAGLSFLHSGQIHSIYAFQGLVNNHVYTLASAGNQILAGTLGGVSLIDGSVVRASYTTANSGLPQNWITASASAWGDVYLGTYGSGVCRMNARGDLDFYREFSTHQHRVEINPNAMLCSANALYAGTAAQGLALLPRGSERWRFVSAGLPSLNVTALEERNGELYVGTANGLVQIAERDLLAQ